MNESSTQSKIEAQIEAILFYTGEPVSLSFLSKTLETSVEEIRTALDSLKEQYSERGLAIVELNDSYTLTTSPAMQPIIEKIIKEERERDLGRAGIEALAIIAYKGPVSKKEIEYIRGVNSQFALRNLLLRGLVERKESKTDTRVILYSITEEALMHLGVTSLRELPEYEVVQAEIQAALQATMDEENAESVSE